MTESYKQACPYYFLLLHLKHSDAPYHPLDHSLLSRASVNTRTLDQAGESSRKRRRIVRSPSQRTKEEEQADVKPDINSKDHPIAVESSPFEQAPSPPLLLPNMSHSTPAVTKRRRAKERRIRSPLSPASGRPESASSQTCSIRTFESPDAKHSVRARQGARSSSPEERIDSGMRVEAIDGEKPPESQIPDDDVIMLYAKTAHETRGKSTLHSDLNLIKHEEISDNQGNDSHGSGDNSDSDSHSEACSSSCSTSSVSTVHLDLSSMVRPANDSHRPRLPVPALRPTSDHPE